MVPLQHPQNSMEKATRIQADTNQYSAFLRGQGRGQGGRGAGGQGRGRGRGGAGGQRLERDLEGQGS
jgi:hypothetical protein